MAEKLDPECYTILILRCIFIDTDLDPRAENHQPSDVPVTPCGTSSPALDRGALFLGRKHPQTAQDTAFKIPGKKHFYLLH